MQRRPSIDPRVPDAPAPPPPIPLAPGNIPIPIDPQIPGRAEAADASAMGRLRTPVSAATWDESLPYHPVNDRPEIASGEVITPAGAEPDVDPNSIEELLKQFIQRSREMDTSRSQKPKWQEEMEKELDPAVQKKRNIARALVAFGSTLAKTPGNFVQGVAQASGPGAATYIEGQENSRTNRTKALSAIDQFNRGNEDASLARMAQAIGLGTAFQKAKGTGVKKKTEGQVKAEAQLEAIKSAERQLRGDAKDGSLPGFEALLDKRNRWGTAAGPYGRGIMTGEGQAALDALRTVIQMSIYSLSGAQAPETEVNRLLGLATPGIMDGPEAIAGKRAQVNSFLDMIHKKAGEEISGPDPEAVISINEETGERSVYVPQIDEWVILKGSE